jgi:hypothetical protein
MILDPGDTEPVDVPATNLGADDKVLVASGQVDKVRDRDPALPTNRCRNADSVKKSVTSIPRVYVRRNRFYCNMHIATRNTSCEKKIAIYIVPKTISFRRKESVLHCNMYTE